MSTAHQRSRVLIYTTRADVRDALAAALGRTALWEVIGHAADPAQLAGLLEVDSPDLVVLDEDLCGGDPLGTLSAATTGRRPPALVLVDTDPPASRAIVGERRVGFLGKDLLLRGGLVATNHVWARLVAMSDLVPTRRRTQTANSLMEAIRRARVGQRHRDQRPQVLTVASWPLDLVVLVGGRGSGAVLTEVLGRLTLTPVPVLVAIPESEIPAPSVRAALRVPVEDLVAPLELRCARGVLLAPPGTHARVDGELIVLERGAATTDEVLDTIASCGQLHSGGLTVLLSGEDTELAVALAGPVNEGGVVTVVEPTSAPQPAAAAAAAEWGLVAFSLSIDELVFILGRAIPRRA